MKWQNYMSVWKNCEELWSLWYCCKSWHQGDRISSVGVSPPEVLHKVYVSLSHMLRKILFVGLTNNWAVMISLSKLKAKKKIFLTWQVSLVLMKDFSELICLICVQGYIIYNDYHGEIVICWVSLLPGNLLVISTISCTLLPPVTFQKG